jgi:hypothetical protein
MLIGDQRMMIVLRVVTPPSLMQGKSHWKCAVVVPSASGVKSSFSG